MKNISNIQNPSCRRGRVGAWEEFTKEPSGMKWEG